MLLIKDSASRENRVSINYYYYIAFGYGIINLPNILQLSHCQSQLDDFKLFQV